MRGLFTSEAVSSGHPDKACDYIADSILDNCLSKDDLSRVAVEVLVKDDFVVLGGEVTTDAELDIEGIVKQAIKEIGYTYTPRVINLLQKQSPDIALGVDFGGAGDQGIMFGYANSETSEYFPLAISIAQDLIREAESLLGSGEVTWVRPDMKSQVTVDYSYDVPRIDTVVMSIQTKQNMDWDVAYDDFIEYILLPVLKRYKGDSKVQFDLDSIKIHFNPTGRFEIGGPEGDAGVTGRKIVVDSYGGYCPVGGGSFSGKDYTKVDRSAAYAARWLAKNIVASGLMDECLVQLSYSIGVIEPTSLNIKGNGLKPGLDISVLEKNILEKIPLSPMGITARFELYKPNYRVWSKNGSFGKTEKPGAVVPWEVVSDSFLQSIGMGEV